MNQLEVQVNYLTKQLKNQADKKVDLEPVSIKMSDSFLDKTPLTPSLEKISVPQGEKKSELTPNQKTFREAQDFFDERNWESAIAKFEEYRRNTSKEKLGYRQATLRIGEAFKNLKLKEESKVFFNELIQSYPESQEAKKAKTLLK